MGGESADEELRKLEENIHASPLRYAFIAEAFTRFKTSAGIHESRGEESKRVMKELQLAMLWAKFPVECERLDAAWEKTVDISELQADVVGLEEKGTEVPE